jgi:SAM-dependent methyltransferase
MSNINEDQLRSAVRDHYGKVAREEPGAGCAPSCCGAVTPESSLALGYSPEDLADVPEGANMGLGCGNPQAIAAISAGETVLDLGSGGGFDCFLAAKQVGATGKVIGVDMTPDMISKARANAEKLGAKNVEFRLGEIERLPVADGEVDAIMSNCVINLSPNKAEVYREAFRVLSPGGRLAISDVVATTELPEALRADLDAISGCVGGAVFVFEVERMLEEAGFTDIRVTVDPKSAAFIANWFPGTGAERYVASATIEAKKAGTSGACCGPSCCATSSVES